MLAVAAGARAVDARVQLRHGRRASSLVARVTSRHTPSFSKSFDVSLIELSSVRADAASTLQGKLEPGDTAVTGSNMEGWKTSFVKKTDDTNGFYVPVKQAVPSCKPQPCAGKEQLSPLEQKIQLAQDEVDRLAKVRKAESDMLAARIQRAKELADSAIEQQLATQESYSAAERKAHQLENEIRDAQVAIEKRQQLLTDPNRFTDACAPGFRVYFVGSAKDRMTYDDKKLLAKSLKDSHCKEENLLCKCDLSKKRITKSILGKVNGGVDCECYAGLAKMVADAEKERLESGKLDSQVEREMEKLSAEGAAEGASDGSAGAAGAAGAPGKGGNF